MFFGLWPPSFVGEVMAQTGKTSGCLRDTIRPIIFTPELPLMLIFCIDNQYLTL